jgi:hypothetical protein
MYFGSKSYLKSTRNHTAKHAKLQGSSRGEFWHVEQINPLFYDHINTAKPPRIHGFPVLKYDGLEKRVGARIQLKQYPRKC